jgi:hypothetical protein
MVEPIAYYFGAVDHNHLGHFLYAPGFRHLRKDAQRPHWWTEGLMDTGLLKNGEHPDVYNGKVFWTCGGLDQFWFAFYWWDRSADSRGNSNSGFYVSSDYQLRKDDDREGLIAARDATFEAACRAFPEVVKRQHQPLQLQD